MEKKNKKGQVGIYVIIALIIFAVLVYFFLIRGNLGPEQISVKLQPVYSYYSDCIKEETQMALDFAGTHGGRIFSENYVPASDYAPFSSQLDFLGTAVPYWYYVSGSGLIRENVPSKSDIEEDVASYIEQNLLSCNFDSFFNQGFVIGLENSPKVNVKISDSKVDVSVNSKLIVSRDGESASQSNFSVSVNSRFGRLYGLAREVYDKEKEEAFLENYSVDVLRLYSPVDGSEVSCSPIIWNTAEVMSNLKKALEANIGQIKFRGNYYSISNKKNEYFVLDSVNLDSGVSASLLYSSSWPSKIEISGSGVDRNLIVANPIGNQQGLGVMGFCYVPYHFVYDVSYPVLIQLYDGGQIFQFPVVVVIDNNVPRIASFNEIENSTEEVNICDNSNNDISISLYDVNLNVLKANASIEYQCFDQSCYLGETKSGGMRVKVPACVNGFIKVRAEGYAEKTQIFSSNSEGSADIVLDKEKKMIIELNVAGRTFDGNAVVSFEGENTRVVALPYSNEITLSEGLYNLSVFVYGNSSIVIPASTKNQCYDAPSSGILGFFGGTTKECVDIQIPETKIESALVGGGKSQVYVFASDLDKETAVISVGSFAKPDSLENLQYNYEIFGKQGVDLFFK